MTKRTDKLARILLLLPVMGVLFGLLLYLILHFMGCDTDCKGSIEEHHRTGNGSNLHPNLPGEYLKRGYSDYDMDFY